MEDKNNNLGDFFRKRLRESETNESWAQPDDDIRNSVLGKITTVATEGAAAGGLIHYSSPLFWSAAAAIGLLVLALGVYTWSLTDQVQELQAQLQEQKVQVETVEVEKTQLQQRLTQATNATAQAKEIAEVATQQFAQQQTTFEQSLQSRGKTIDQLQQQQRILQDSITQLANSIHLQQSPPNTTDEAIATLPKTTTPTLTNEISPAIFTKPVEPLTYSLPTPAMALADGKRTTKNHKRFEVGYELTTFQVDVPISRTFQNQRHASETRQNNPVSAVAHGLNFGYSPGQKWWIKTGIRRASVQLQRRFSLGVAYDRTNEQMQPGEPTTNELFLITQAGDADIQSSFRIRFQQGRELEEGELMEVGIQDFLAFDQIQVPLGIEHYAGSGKLQLLFQGGMLWNYIRYKDYNFTASIRARGRPIMADRGRVLSEQLPDSNYFSMFGGLGVDYQLIPNWHLRATFNYNYDFSNTQNQDMASTSKSGTALKLGLNYRF